ncbi:MAG: sulfotransferase family protein [Solirubrobacteraceae bacterium]
MTTGPGSSGAAGAPDAGVPELSAPALMSAAAARAGYDNWDQDGFVEPLTLLIESSLATGHLSETGRRVLRSVLLRHLRNRLDVRAHLDRRPQAAHRQLEAPIVITGLPRTGTSLLHNLLAQDPRHRFLRLWEGLHPTAPEPGQGPDEATLVRQAERWLERFYALAPGFRAVHPLTPQGPEECDALLQNSFTSQHFDDMFDAEAYSRWFHAADLQREYAYYALQLRLLSSDRDAHRRWVLKSPGHLGHLDALLGTLPGARVVHCHRDPAQAVPSYASLILTVRAPNTEAISPERIGEQALARCTAAMSRALRVRAGAEESSFYDLSFRALVADPIRTVTRLYAWLGTRLDPQVEASMRRWLAENPRDRHGSHDYDPVAFELPQERVRAALRDYLDRFESFCGSSTVA